MTEDEAREGYRYELKVDPDDPRFEILTMRRPRNSNFGGQDTPLVNLSGNLARLRWIRMSLAHTLGLLSGRLSESAIKQIRRAHESFKDPD